MNLSQIYKKFPSEKSCIEHLESIRWNGVPRCPYCRVTEQSKLCNEYRYHCNACNTSYSVTVGTVFKKTRIDLQKWFYAIYIIYKEEISVRKLSEKIHVNRNTAWRMIKRIKMANREFMLKIIS